MKRQDGMSLIAILITIPVVLILGAITVGLALGEHGLLNAKTYEEYNKKVEQQRAAEEALSSKDSAEESAQENTSEEAAPQEQTQEAAPAEASAEAPAEAPAQTEAPAAE